MRKRTFVVVVRCLLLLSDNCSDDQLNYIVLSRNSLISLYQLTRLHSQAQGRDND